MVIGGVLQPDDEDVVQEVDAVGRGLHRIEQARAGSGEAQKNRRYRERHCGAVGRKCKAVTGFPHLGRAIEIRHPIVVGVNQQEDRKVERSRKSEPDRPASCEFAVLGEQAKLQACRSDPDAGEEVRGVKQDTAGLDRKWKPARACVANNLKVLAWTETENGFLL